ncbi:MAG: DNA replication/repair protein RecF [Robiginitomaculum sp.]
MPKFKFEALKFVHSLLLTNYRSYEELNIQFDGRPVVLFGENGAGKTNLLEAISLLSPGRGLRRTKLEDIVRRDDKILPRLWSVASEIKTGNDLIKAGTGQIQNAPRRRQIRIDGKPASGVDFAALLTVNWLTPEQDRLFVGPAADRRKFFDRLCLARCKSHGRTFLTYEKARRERGRLLAEGIDDDYWFDALETDLAKRGAKIAKARFETLQKLQEEISARPQGAFPKAVIGIEGEAETLYQNGADERDVYEFIKAALQRDRPIDKRAGRTLRGVHKSDLIVSHMDKNMPAKDCSTGEQKALLIGLFLAHARAQSAHSPILLLDEVAAHLDEVRRAALVDELLELGTQVFMTGTDKNLFKAFKGWAQIFKVTGGTLEACD